MCVDSERLPIRESDVAGIAAAAKVIIDSAHQTLATNPGSMYGPCPLDASLAARPSFSVCPVCGLVWVVDAELLFSSPGRMQCAFAGASGTYGPPSLPASGASSSKPK
jgi:hypothetical protein